MIDQRLIKQAQGKSEAIEIIDSSWRSHMKSIRENICTIPFIGSYPALVEDRSIMVEGYAGPLLIDKLYCRHKTYWLKPPVSCDPFKIYGVYDSRGKFECFVSHPEIGFHYLGMNGFRHGICTGDIQYPNPDSLESLKEAASKIIDSFRLINLESLGTVLLPETYAQLRDIFSNKDQDSKTKLERLLREGLIEEIL
jgi:hypothetical protein